MPDVAIEKGITLDLLDQQKPGTSVTSDMPVIETHPDASPKPKPEAAPEKAKEEESAPSDKPADAAAAPDAEDKPKAKGVQKRIDELTSNWREEQRARAATQAQLDRAMVLLEKAMTGKPADAVTTEEDAEPVEPDTGKFTDQTEYNTAYRQYLKDLARHEGRQAAKATQKQERDEAQKRTREEGRRKTLESYNANVVKAREKYPDYDAVVYAESVPFTAPMTDAIVESDNGPDIAYHLAQNPQEVVRISQLSPRRQLMELGLISAKLAQPAAPAAAPAVAKAPTIPAPKPITPIASGGGAASATRGEPSMEEYAAKRTKELAKERVPGGMRR